MAGNWSDLSARFFSSLVMAALGVAAIWAGGLWFAALAVAAAGTMIWELAVMSAPDARIRALGLGASAAALVCLAVLLGGFWAGLLAVPGLALVVMARSARLASGLYALAIMLASYGLIVFRADYGMVWLIWLVLVVVVTDVAGYFAGRLFGGPKFWPAISPKKTWSGTLAGWGAAAGVGYVFLEFTTAGPDLPWISAGIALASQMGDIAESAIKRHAGVKDSSHLIPGHGGLLDRFDGLLGASLMMLVVALVVVVPEIRM